MPDETYLDSRGKFKAGNPGKPKGLAGGRPIESALRMVINEIDEASGTPNAEVIARKVVSLAKEGTEWACKYVKEHLEGKAREQVAIEVTQAEPIKLFDVGADQEAE